MLYRIRARFRVTILAFNRRVSELEQSFEPIECEEA